MKRFSLLALLVAGNALGRVIPTARIGPDGFWGYATQRLTDRHMVLEPCNGSRTEWSCRLIVYDSKDEEPPRDVTPPFFEIPGLAAAREDNDGTLRIFAAGAPRTSGGPAAAYSADGGRTWAPVSLAGSVTGVRIGTAEVPFVLTARNGDEASFHALHTDGSIAFLAWGYNDARLLGSDREGSRFLAYASRFEEPPPSPPYQVERHVGILDVSGKLDALFTVVELSLEGWITPAGTAYFNGTSSANTWLHSVSFWNGRSLQNLLKTNTYLPPVIAQTADGSGAWIATIEDVATVLRTHTEASGLSEVWRDATRPLVTDLVSGASGRRLLLASRRYRQAGGSAIRMAIWNVGEAAPAQGDEILAGSDGVSLVHVDVDAMAEGAAFFVNSANPESGGSPGGILEPEPRQPLGMLRASLRQQLVIPAAARSSGIGASAWRTDLVVSNPESTAVGVTARLLPNLETAPHAPDARLSLAPNATLLAPDVLHALFGLERGAGAILLVPDGAARIRATSWTYTEDGGGRYGMSVDGVDVQAAARPGLPITFAAALQGAGFRTNFVAADLSGRGSTLELRPSSGDPLPAAAGPWEQSQLSDLAALAGAPPSVEPPLRATSTAGEWIGGVIAIDDQTNDPGWFAPDVPEDPGDGFLFPTAVHVDGVGGAAFRTDLFLWNPGSYSSDVSVTAADVEDPHRAGTVVVTLQPGESTVRRDVVGTLVPRARVTRLSVWSSGARVKATSRTYAVTSGGATYGMVVPPLGRNEIANGGETLEIVGPAGGANRRTNLTLLPLGEIPEKVAVEILDENGVVRDSFDVVLAQPFLQIDDLFRQRGFGDGPTAARIRLTPRSWPLAAYATTIDNGTNDPVYFAGALGSH